jgi:ribosomal protein S18 acetylase RimI-like enzyme
MIYIDDTKPTNEDCRDLARITLAARKGTPMEPTAGPDELVKSIVRIMECDDYKILVARRDDIPVGWMYYYTAFPLMSFVSGFYPVVRQNKRSRETAMALIEAAKKNTLDEGRTRLEIQVELPTDAHRSLSMGLIDWYRKCGFQFAAEEAHMASDLNALNLPELMSPNGCTLGGVEHVPIEDLMGLGFCIFERSSETLYLSMSPAERQVTIEHFYDKDESYMKDASLVLEKDGKYIGVVMARLRDEGVDIGSFGILPDYRGRGLAKYLLGSALRKLKQSGIAKASLDVSITNPQAMRLYKRFGFEEELHKQFYYWSP